MHESLVTRFSDVAGLQLLAVTQKQMGSLLDVGCGGQYLVDSVKNGVGSGAPKGVDHLPKDDRHDHLRHTARKRGDRAGQHQHHVRAVRVLEQVMERRLPILGHLLLAAPLLLSTLQCSISSSCSDFFSHAMPT